MQSVYTVQNYKVGEYVLPELRWGRLVLENPPISILTQSPFPRDRVIVGVMGSSGKERGLPDYKMDISEEQKHLGEMIGRIVAERGCVLLNGALWGLPYFPIRGAHQNGGYTMGISPYKDKDAHIKKNPTKHFDLILYTGLGVDEFPKLSFVFRDFVNTIYPDLVISLKGKWGTMDECSHILEQGGIYIPVKGSGGTTDVLVEAIQQERIVKDTGARGIIPGDSANGLEMAINEGIDEAVRRWQIHGRIENRFSPVADRLEQIMKAA